MPRYFRKHITLIHFSVKTRQEYELSLRIFIHASLFSQTYNIDSFRELCVLS